MFSQKRAPASGKQTSHSVMGYILEAIEPALTVPDRLVAPDSWAGHIPFAFWLTAAFSPRRYVELGVHTGNSYCAVAQTVSILGLKTDSFGIDHWFGDEQAGLYGEDVYADLKAWHDPRYGHFSKLLRMSFEDGRAHVADRTVDLLHIDGLHTYEAVRTDFETWRAKMSDRGIVLFHDTNVHRSDFGVWQYWREMQDQFPTFEFLHSNGLGVAYVGSRPLTDLPEPVAALFADGREDQASPTPVRSLFARLGVSLVQQLRLAEARRGGESASRQLHQAYQDLAAIDIDRAAILADRDVIRERALKWDRLAVRTGGAIGLDLDEMSAALDQLFNSDNPQARRDRSILKRQFSELMRSGTFDTGYKDRATALAAKAIRRVRARLGDRAPVVEYPDIAAIRSSGLFREDSYALAAEAKSTGLDPLEHYLRFGEAAHIAPSALFNPGYYARRQPDVAKSGFGLLRHYVLFGQHEARQALSPAQRLHIPPRIENERQRVLLLFSDANASDEVTLGWNLAKTLNKTCDVTAFFKSGGALRAAFDGVCAATIDLPDEEALHREDLTAIVQRLKREIAPSFVLATSVEVRDYVRSFVAEGTGVVQLVQSFANSIRPAGGAYEFLPWAQRLVFPSQAVAKSFRSEHPYLSHRRFDVLPSSILETPGLYGTPFGSQEYAESVRKRLRSAHLNNDFLVIAAGEISSQSGVDLFASVAASALKKMGSSKRALKFVWIGNGFDPNGPDEFSNLLSDQIKRSGLESHFEIIGSMENLEEVFRQADLFALTARLDPLPNSALNALAAGVPVVCFDGNNSLAERLHLAGGQLKSLVAPYLDLEAMADIICRMADDETRYQSITAAISNARPTDADTIETYVAKLVELGEEAAREAQAVDKDYAEISSAEPIFSEEVFGGTWPADAYPQDMLRTYLSRWRVATSSGKMPPIGLRRPLAGFNPVIYAEDVLGGDASQEPLTHWLRHGKPDGRWTHPVINLQSPAAAASSGLRTLLHGHFFYTDLIDDFLDRVNRNLSQFDILLTVPDEARAARAREALEQRPLRGAGNSEILVVENVGRDIGPLLNGIGYDRLSGYDIVGHVHGKKSPHVETVTGDQWRVFLWEHLLGGKTSAADVCLEAFTQDEKLGLIFAEDAHLHGWDANLDIAAPLARKMGREIPLPAAFEWPIGTMFWARPAAIKPLFDLGLANQDYPKEPLPGDGTLLHALERLIPFAVDQAGFSYATTHLEEVQR